MESTPINIPRPSNAAVQQHGSNFGCVHFCRPGGSLPQLCFLSGCSQAPWPRIQAGLLSTTALWLHRLTLVCSMCILPSICKLPLLAIWVVAQSCTLRQGWNRTPPTSLIRFLAISLDAHKSRGTGRSECCAALHFYVGACGWPRGGKVARSLEASAAIPPSSCLDLLVVSMPRQLANLSLSLCST